MKAWKRGEKSKLAAMTGVSKGHIGNMLNRRDRASAELALRLEKACIELRIPIRKEDWIFNRETDNEFFAPKN